MPLDTFDPTRASVLKTLKKLVCETNHSFCARSVLITHVIPTAARYIDLVNQVYPVSLVIAIPYSADLATIARIRKKDIPVFLPENVDAAFLESGPLVESLLKRDLTPLVVQEVGGYLAGYANLLAAYPHFLGIVEDTNNGHWRYADAGTQNVPILSMARSPIKDIEDTVIGDSIIYSTERIFREEFHCVLQGMQAAVIGYGKIGTSTAISLRGRECPVMIYDIDPTKCIKARFEGFRIRPLQQLLQESELIVGCTGKTSVRLEDVDSIRHRAILVSGSAKNEEFDLPAFEIPCSKEELFAVVWKYTQKDGRYFYLLHQGTPVNFRDRSILGFILDMIYSELFLCIRHIVEKKPPKGLQHSPPSIHNTVAQEWLKIYEPSFVQEARDKVWQFPSSLACGVTHTFCLQTRSK